MRPVTKPATKPKTTLRKILSAKIVPAIQPSHKAASIMRSMMARPVSPCAIGINQLRIILRCGNGASGWRGFVRDGSERAEFRCVDTIRINKLDPNDSGFSDFTHDTGQKHPLFGAPGRNRTCDPWLRRPILYPLSYGRQRNCIRLYCKCLIAPLTSYNHRQAILNLLKKKFL